MKNPIKYLIEYFRYNPSRVVKLFELIIFLGVAIICILICTGIIAVQE